MTRLKPHQAAPALTALVQLEHWGDATKVLLRAADDARNLEDWEAVAALYRQMPPTHLLETPVLAMGYATSLAKSRQAADLLAFTTPALSYHQANTELVANLALEHAWGLSQMGQHLEAHQTLSAHFHHFPQAQRGMAWRFLALSEFALQKPGWPHSFQQAKQHSHGHDLALTLIDEGYCLDLSGKGLIARGRWHEAVSMLTNDLFHQAWTFYNLGVSALRDLSPEAEHYFLQAEQLIHSRQAARLRARVWIGLAAARRVRGEFSRAEFAYRLALDAAKESDDRRTARSDLALTLRLAGQPALAVGELRRAITEAVMGQGQAALRGLLIAPNVALGDANEARAALPYLELLSANEAIRAKIALAELARRQQRLDEAQSWLTDLPIHTLAAREEARLWPQLFDFAHAAGLPIPEPLPLARGLTTNVYALGGLRVMVNQRPINLAETSRAGELLVLLLERGGSASVEELASALWPTVKQRAGRDQLRHLGKALQEALGWELSLHQGRGVYRLDASAQWWYDLHEARQAKVVRGQFLPGVLSEWALETNQKLDDLRSPSDLEALN
jgi:tetratricopeptide (TPR) repeat protein